MKFHQLRNAITLRFYLGYLLFGTLTLAATFLVQSMMNPSVHTGEKLSVLAARAAGIPCDLDCGHNGTCTVNSDNSTFCLCDPWFVDDPESGKANPCSYKRTNKLTLFLVSFFVGWTGADWYIQVRGGKNNGAYIAAGIFKLLTLDGCGIWGLVDWIRVLTDTFPDSNGVTPYYPGF